MKCPDCGNTDKLSHLGPVAGKPDLDGYHCARCGRLFTNDAPKPARAIVVVEESGIGTLLTLANRLPCEELRGWLKNQRCQVGPIFEPVAGTFAFYVYKKRESICDLIGQHGRFTVEMAKG